MSVIKTLTVKIKNNLLEVWASICLFIGLPVAVGLYLDYRAALLLFFVLSSIVSILALRAR